MKKEFQNLAIECWQTGRLGVADKSICLQAASGACGVFLGALDDLASQGVPAHRKLTLLPPKRHLKKFCSVIRVTLSAESAELQQMSLKRENDVAQFEFTPLGLQMFREAVVRWQNGGEDFGIGPRWKRNKKEELGAKDLESVEVWFWTSFTDPF